MEEEMSDDNTQQVSYNRGNRMQIDTEGMLFVKVNLHAVENDCHRAHQFERFESETSLSNKNRTIGKERKGT